MTLYSASSLADIAAHFERRAVDCQNRADSADTEKTRRNYTSQAMTWREAAQIVLQTTLPTVGYRYRFGPYDGWTLVADKPTGLPLSGEIEALAPMKMESAS